MTGAAKQRKRVLSTAYRHADSLVRDLDRDRWIAGLFGIGRARLHVMALFAFNVEITRVREVVHDPMPGLIRLQWWQDLLEGGARGDPSGHPVALALLDTIEIYRLPRKPFLDLIEARIFDLYDDPMPTLSDLEGYAGEVSSTLIQLAAIILNDGATPPTADASGHAGVALTLTAVMLDLPRHTRRGQVYLPLDLLRRHGLDVEGLRRGLVTPGLTAALGEMREHVRHHLDHARKGLSDVDPQLLPAFLPLALVEPTLKELARADPFGGPEPLSALRRQWLLWSAARRGRRRQPMF